LRTRFYSWRQTQPVGRLITAGLFIALLPLRAVIFRLANLRSHAQETHRILVIHTAGLGDLLMLTPALAALRERYPNAEVDLITLHEYVKEAFHNHPYLDTIRTLPAYRGQWIISRFSSRASVRLIFATIRFYSPLLLNYLFSRHEVGINFGLSDFDRSLGNALMFCLNVPTRIGSEGPGARLLTHAVSVNCQRTHRATTYLELLKPLNVSTRDLAYEFPVRQHDLDRVKLALRRGNIDPAKPLAIVNPGGKMHINSRRWPAEYYARVCRFLNTEEGFQIVLTGDQDDRDVCEEIAQSQKQSTQSMAGSFSFAETAALLSLAQLCVTNDTSTLHLAEAVQVPRVISIFGPTNPTLLAPQNERNIVFQSHLECAPCMGGLIDAQTQRCWRDIKEECLWSITPDQIIAVLKTGYQDAALRVASA
jgi:ADP-heptose:LPS heptosyltransferase